MNAVLEAVYLLDLTPAILDTAATLDPPHLRSLDAIHVASALSVGEADLDMITYDIRCADAARASGLTVAQPAR